MKSEELKAMIEEAAKDDAFVNQLLGAETPEEVQKLFAEKNINLTTDDIKGIAEELKQSGDEMNEESLEAISGGCPVSAWDWFKHIVFGTKLPTW